MAQKKGSELYWTFKKSESHEKIRSPNSKRKTEELVKPKVAIKMFAYITKLSFCE